MRRNKNINLLKYITKVMKGLVLFHDNNSRNYNLNEFIFIR